MRQMGAGLTISKISDDFGLDIKKKKLAARYHRNIVGPFFSDKGSYVGATPNKLLNLLKDMYSLSPVENNQLISKTNNLLDMDEIKANPDFTGRDPATMLGGAAYLVIRNWDYRKVVYEKDLAEKIGKTNVSIGKAYKSLDTFLKQKGYDVRSLVKFL
jgi:hypothetical protein